MGSEMCIRDRYRYSDVTVPTGGTLLLERFTQPSGANDVSRESFAPLT